MDTKIVNERSATEAGFTGKEPIAIVGIGCRTPGKVQGPADLWKALLSGIDCVTTVPPDRWNVDEYYDPNPDKAGKIKTRRGGFIEGIDLFDNEFFRIFPTEAERIDPQQRILLECAFEALEDAGDTLALFRGSNTAVYMGVFMNDYWDLQVDGSNRYSLSPHVPMGSSLTSLANRISFVYDLKGPSISIDTACSSSLVTVHLACQGIWRGESEAAVAGGVNIMINPESTVMMSKGNFLSPDGACKSFDESANGYVRSEGAGVVYLKPLSRALADNNQIYGLIRGSACNSDGFTADGFTVPNSDAQTTMLKAACRDAGVLPGRVQYIEAHGTGTPVGDPLETRAFANVFGDRPASEPLLIGSVKSNVGHLEGAAGVTGLIKLALSLRHKQIPGNLHFRKGNPKIDFENWRLRVVDSTRAWPAQGDGTARLGGVNSFGAGGTNAHVVVEEFVPQPEQWATEAPPALHVFTCSANTKEALRSLLAGYRAYAERNSANLNDICYNAGKFRSAFRHRIAIVARDSQDFLEKSEAFLSDSPYSGVEYSESNEKTPRLGFVFTGQGPQWWAMGRQLIAGEPLFRAVIERIDALFLKLAGWSLMEEMGRSEEASRVNDTRIAQPAIMALQIGLVEFWKLHGVAPAGVVGHSIGEVAAAYTAGALSLEQAVQVIYHRSRGQHQATGKGVMLAVGLNLNEATSLITGVRDVVSIAAVNGPESVTLSGDDAPLRAIAAKLEARDVFHRFLKVNVPFHSHHMEPLREELVSSLQDLRPSAAKIPVYSTVTGKREDGLHLTSSYWYDNVREPVYFSGALEVMLRDGFDLFVEIGPHPALSSGAEELFAKLGTGAQICPSLRRGEAELLRFKQTLGILANRGHQLDWDKICPAARRLDDLPRYPWQRRSFWHESRSHREHRLQRRSHPHVIRHSNSGRNADEQGFEILLDRTVEPYLDDHRVDDMIIFPATGHLELATAAARRAFGGKFGFLEDVNFESGLFLPDEGEAPEIRLEVYSDEGRYWLMSRDRSAPGAPWTRHSNGRMNNLGDRCALTPVNLAELRSRITDRLPVQPLYNDLKQSGLFYGATFRAVENLWTAPGEILGKIRLHESLKHGIGDYLLHPSVLDACLHTIFAAQMSGEDSRGRGVFLPVHIARYVFVRQPVGDVVWSYVRVSEASADFLNGDFVILDENGSTIAEVQGLRCKFIAGSNKSEDDVAHSGCYEYRWEEAGDLNLNCAAAPRILVIGDDAWEHAPLLAALGEAGAEVITMGSGEGFDRAVDLLDRQAVQREIEAVKAEDPTLGRVLVTLPLGQTGEADLPERTEELAWKLLNVNNAMISGDLHAAMWTLTRTAEPVLPTDGAVNLVQATVTGLSRVLSNEYPMVIARVIDMDRVDEAELQSLAEILTSTSHGGNETELALRHDRILVKRLVKVTPADAQVEASVELPASGACYEAFFAEPGILDSVRFRRFAPRVLAPGEVEIAVKAAALNFKDVMNGMGLLSAESVAGGLVGSQLGLECSGVVSRVGSAVTRFRAGDAVVAMAPRSIAGVAVTPEHCVVRKPEHLSFEEAATVTIVYLTAWHCLVDLASLEEGERVLIHSGTGGVGIAAIRLAQLRGAEIFATAGSEEKREVLRRLGVRHVYDSRTLEFHDQIMADTSGEGIDVVLNSLSGKAIVQSLKCLRAFGRFVEIGKTDIYEDAALYLKRFGNNLSYFAVDVDRLMAQKPARGGRLFAEVIRLFEERRLPAHPFTAFPVSELAEALEFIARGRQTGKVVVTMEGHSVSALPAAGLVLNPQRVYLITGGASGFGLELARWLTEKGARKLVLASRSGPKSDYDRHWIEALRKGGTEIVLPRVDLGSAEAVRELLIQARLMGEIGGVIHGAAVLEDSTVGNLDRTSFRRVFDAKARGAWNLHQALAADSPDFFLCLSSISSVFGLPGQSSYSAANNFLDKLTLYRNQRNQAAQSVNLGVLGQYAGMSKEGGSVLNVLESQGWMPLTIGQATAKIERILLEGNVVRMAANIDWLRFREFFPNLRSDARFAHLLSDEALNLKGKGTSGDSLRDRLRTLAAGEAAQSLIAHLTEALARILGVVPDTIDPQKSVSAIGLDSLMMNQLRNWISRRLEVNYPLMRMAKGPSLAELTGQLLEECNKGALPAVHNAESSGIADDPEVEVVNRWFVRRRRKPGDAAAPIRLFMFHSMGAGASMFAHFLYNPPPGCEVYCVQLPGRENRMNEAPYTDLQPLLRDMEEAMLPLLDGDFALYGHSYGGIVAFETARLLRRKHGLIPLHFFASATMAPQMTLTWKNRDVMRESTISSNSEQKLIGLMSYIDDLDFVKQILPGMRRDMPLLMGYEYRNELPMECPVTVFSALEDEVTLPEEMSEWKHQTSSRFSQEFVHGDHWFVSRNKEFIGSRMADDLREHTAVEQRAEQESLRADATPR